MIAKDIVCGQYEIIRKIGEGGTANVYLAYDRINELEISLKVLKNDNIDQRKLKYFKREAELISMLDDPNIIKIYDVGYDQEKDRHFIAQEYVEGMTLKEYLKISGKISPTEAVEISKKILSGLQHAHKSNVIHKDIKGQNILIDIEKKIKITDFGIADIMEEDITRTQSLMGTPQYVAPETLNRSESSAQTDIYSIGILMYELLCGSAPFTGEKPTVIMMKQLNQPLPSIKMQVSQVSQSLENIVIKATAKRLSNRYKNAEEVLKDLDKVFLVEQENVEKIFFADDLLEKEELEKTIKLDGDFNLDEENKKEQKKKKVNKIKKIILITSLIVISCLIIGLFISNYKTNEMPDLIGENIDIAENILKIIGVDEDKIEIKYQISDEYNENTIIETKPKANTDLEKDQIIILTVSSGKEKIILDDYSGLIYTDVQTTLEELGLKVKIEYEQNSVTQGIIIDQDPVSGSELEKGDEITITVSEGKKEISMPNFITLKEDQVSTWADDNDINISRTYQCDDIYGDGIVVKQSPSSGSIVEDGSTVEITVSDGICPNQDDSLLLQTSTDESEQ